jgi:hypothetical protein
MLKSSVDIGRCEIVWDANPSLILDRLDHSVATWMAESLVQPEYLSNLVCGDAEAMSSGLNKWVRCDDVAESLWVLELDGEREELFYVHVEHVTAFVDNALMHELALKIYTNAAGDLKGDFKTLATEDGYADESVWCALQNCYLANDLSEISVVCATLALAVGELNPASSGPELWS